MSSPDRTNSPRGIPGILKRALQPLRRRRRDRETLEPFAYGESAEMGEINPQEVADALDSAARWRQDPTPFYELVNRMGVSAVYRSASRTRRHSITQLEPIVEPVSETGIDPQVAEAVKDKVLPMCRQMAGAMLRAAGHGVSVVQLQWYIGSSEYFPIDFIWRPPKQFRAVEDDRRLWHAAGDFTSKRDYDGLRAPVVTGTGGWIDHRADADGSTPFVSGHATPCLLWWLAKIRARVRWAAFIDTYGFPLRVGHYNENTSAEDIEVLRDAVKNIGRDIGALLPEDMRIDIINAAATIGGTSDYFARMVDISDKQIEIEVLGQTASTEGTPGQLGENKAQDRVRRDIALADAIALGHTQTDQLAEPFVRYNFGVNVPVPEILWIVPEPPDDLEAWSKAVYRMTGRGLLVLSEEIYKRLHLTAPKEGDETIGGVEDEETTDSGGGGNEDVTDDVGDGDS